MFPHHLTPASEALGLDEEDHRLAVEWLKDDPVVWAWIVREEARRARARSFELQKQVDRVVRLLLR